MDNDAELKAALEGLKGSYKTHTVSKLNVASTGNTSPPPSKGRDSARSGMTPLAQSKLGREVKSPKSALGFFNKLQENSKQSKIGQGSTHHLRRATISDRSHLDSENLKPRGSHK